MRHLSPALVVVVVIVAASLSCGPEPFPKCEGNPATPALSGMVWHRDVRPIIEGRCMRCHVDGGLAPFPLTNLDDVNNNLTAVGDAVSSRRMPPWMPAKCCGKFQDDPSLTADEIGTITSWIKDGAPEGNANDVGPALDAVASLARVDATLTMPDAYLPDVQHHDDTRCFILDWPFHKTTFVTGFAVAPGARAQVHHALVVTAPASALGNFQALDDADAGLGWSCPGGVILGIDDYIGGWSPGWDAQLMPKDTGHKVDKDDVVILTVHYTKPHEHIDVTEDQTSVDVMVEDHVADELTSITVMNAAWAFDGLPIPKDNPDVRFAAEYAPTDVYSGGKPIEIVGVNLHMHERGKSGLVGIKHADGTTDCLVQVDAYDHAWQGDYTFVKSLSINPGDRAYVECHFDNSKGHQRIVDGVPEQPRDLNWAEDGEMCVGFITAKKPR